MLTRPALQFRRLAPAPRREPQDARLTCLVCFDDSAEAGIVNRCGHTMCWQCATSYCTSKLEDRRFPVPCAFPRCAAEMHGNAVRGLIGMTGDRKLAQLLFTVGRAASLDWRPLRAVCMPAAAPFASR